MRSNADIVIPDPFIWGYCPIELTDLNDPRGGWEVWEIVPYVAGKDGGDHMGNISCKNIPTERTESESVVWKVC